jgi:hypothetical protein
MAFCFKTIIKIDIEDHNLVLVNLQNSDMIRRYKVDFIKIREEFLNFLAEHIIEKSKV